ncbi:apolipoprotein D-like [Pecten maximus]|uniref:apolipoprotein D-like n=1 Tax=Pecten maximus TaxID=6579 RepID=UPI00145912D5|nr:apolipoprotein D-like [Pecten maximus]
MDIDGQVLSHGKCPNVEPMPEFKIQPFLGVWYEVFRFYDQFEENQSCIRMEYTLKPDGHIGLHNFGDMPDNTTVVAEGDGYVADPSTPARYMVTFADSSQPLDYSIVATDYIDHALVFSCTEILGMANAQFAWVLSRNRTIDSKVMRGLTAKLSCYGVDIDYFEDSPQLNC